eukprot:TRINITY_DN8956_c0_g1_i1.p1 TRINITY_DN8956_c0_g1~~TRINITY_DN8956_c0_g1_i1.p1  ORF type:complete len:129 (-),score=19.20 TRINITY_DN8956_c0_g1_i1:133-519(-)
MSSSPLATPDNNSFAEVCLVVASQSLKICGQGIALVSAIYLGEIFFKSARLCIEALPKIIRRVDDSGKGEAITWQDNVKTGTLFLQKYGWRFIKLVIVLSIGVSIRVFAHSITSEHVFALSKKYIDGK